MSKKLIKLVEKEKSKQSNFLIGEPAKEEAELIEDDKDAKEEVVVLTRKLKKKNLALDDFKLFALQSNNNTLTEKILRKNHE